MKKKVLIIGSKGMAGHVIYQYLNESGKYEVSDISRSDDFFISTYKMDVSETSQLNSILENINPDVVINCVGLLNKVAEENPAKAILLNSYLPHFLANKGDKMNFSLIHLSTDCVFNGLKGNYNEMDFPDGTGFYARSKSLGEVNYGKHLTLRTSILGPELKSEGIGLFDWFMNQRGKVNGYTKVIWTGITTLTLSKVIEQCIDSEIKGLHHVVNGISLSKFELLKIIKEIFNKTDVEIVPYEQYVSNKSLEMGKLSFKIGDYHQMVTELREWMQSHFILYKRYKKNNHL